MLTCPYGISVITPATGYPVDVNRVMDYCNAPQNDRTLIEDIIREAVDDLQRGTSRFLLDTVVEQALDVFPKGDGVIELMRGPVSSLTSVTIIDTDGNSTVVDSSVYLLTTSREPARLEPAYGEVWPSTRDVHDAVKVRYVVGYGSDESDVPEWAKAAIRMYVAERYAGRELSIMDDAARRAWSSILLANCWGAG